LLTTDGYQLDYNQKREKVFNSLRSRLTRSRVLHLNEPILIAGNAIPTMGILCGLATEGEIVNQSRPISSTVYQGSRKLIEEESCAAGELHCDRIGAPSSDFKQGTYVLAVV